MMTTAQQSLSRRRKHNQFSLASLFVVLTIAAAAFAAFRPAALLHLGVFVACFSAFYAILGAVAVRLRDKPLHSAVAWVSIRVAAIIPFALTGVMIPGDEGFAAAMYGYFPDIPLWPIFSAIGRLREGLQALLRSSGIDLLRDYGFSTVHWIAVALNCLIYVAWYGGGGYFTARWARRRYGNRMRPANTEI